MSFRATLGGTQLVHVLALLGARQEQARYRDWSEFPPAGWPMLERKWGSAQVWRRCAPRSAPSEAYSRPGRM